jgi:hypothetical protein
MQGNTVTMKTTHLSNSMKKTASVFRRLVGCRHSLMSQPYTVNDQPYRTCLECGARRRFDRYTWAKLHPYYF